MEEEEEEDQEEEEEEEDQEEGAEDGEEDQEEGEEDEEDQEEQEDATWEEGIYLWRFHPHHVSVHLRAVVLSLHPVCLRLRQRAPASRDVTGGGTVSEGVTGGGKASKVLTGGGSASVDVTGGMAAGGGLTGGGAGPCSHCSRIRSTSNPALSPRAVRWCTWLPNAPSQL